MRKASLFAALGFVSLVGAGPCPFHQLRDTAVAGNLSSHETAIVERMARDPSFIPALDPEAAALMRRAAVPMPVVTKAAPVEPNAVEEPGPPPSILPKIGGSLCKFTYSPLSCNLYLLICFLLQ